MAHPEYRKMSEEGAGPKSFVEALKSLFRLDCTRFSRLAETAQYAALYGFIGLFVGVGLDALFSKIYPVKDREILDSWSEFWRTVGVMILQVVSSAIAVFYMRKVAQVFPLVLNFCPSKYKVGYHVPERVGEIAIALVFVGSMGTLLENIDRCRLFLTGAAPKGPAAEAPAPVP